MYKQPKTNIVVNLSNESCNVLKLCNIVVSTLKNKGYDTYAKELSHRIWGLHSKSEAVSIFSEYITVN